MNDWLNQLCGSGFMPHGQCYLWSPGLIWLHAIADGLIALAYFSIPLALVHFVRRRRDVPYKAIFLLFGAFIVACSATHVLEVWTIWHSHYYLSGGVKAVTAVISLFTAVALVRIMPEALRLPGREELQRLNDSLETRVQERTRELEEANAALTRENRDRLRAEAEVRRLNEVLHRRVDELQSLIKALPIGVGIADDPGCRVIRMNSALAEMLRLPHDANASLTAPPEEAPRNFRVLQDGQPVSPEDLPMQVCARENRALLRYDETVVHADGSRLNLIVSCVPLRDPQGNSTGCVATFQDVTELKSALASSAQYAAIIADSSDAIIGKNLDGIVTTWNRGAESIFGYSAGEMIGQPILRLFPADRADEETGILAQITRGEIVRQFDTVRVRKDGSPVEVSVQISPIRDLSGRIIGASKSARDISERKKAERVRQEMERKIQETQKLESLGVLAGGIAHDFNNLLTGVLGGASLARSALPPGSSLSPILEQIETSAKRAADLCRQMLAYAGRGRFVVQALDLNQLIRETTHLLNISISKNCVMRFNLAERLPAITADATQIRQVVMNLVINASEAIGAKSGVIALTTGMARIDRDYLQTLRHDTGLQPGDYVFLEVSDNGCGMDAATVARIFDPFFTTKFTGRGLGLAAVLGIIRSQRGALKVYSEPGSGSTFKLFFPCSDEPAEPLALTDQPTEAWRGSGRVLVVDDEETVRAVAARILESLGFEIELAADGREAVEKFRAAPARYTLVLLDLTMPHFDGEETFRQLRHLLPGVRVVLMSGFNEQEAVSRFTGKGLAGFVQKPFEVGSLVAAVRSVLRAR